MPAASVIRVEDGYDREPDCAVVSLAMYLGATYAEVIRAVVMTMHPRAPDGLSRRGIVRVAGCLGHTLRRRRIDPDDGHGIIVTPTHAAVLLSGRVLDRYSNWPIDAWLIDQGVTLDDCDLYTAVDE
jgi:hypothetical protein